MSDARPRPVLLGSRRRILGSLACLPLLSGCGLVDTDSPFWSTLLSVGASRTVPPVDRDYVNRVPYASMLAWFDKAPTALLILGEVQDTTLTWFSADRQAVVTQGAYIVRTAGLDMDVSARIVAPAQPIPSPLDLVGAALHRMVDVKAYGRFGQKSVSTFRRAGQEEISILGISYILAVVIETVRTESGQQVENTYWVDDKSKFTWKSRQQLIPELPALNLEITKPFSI